MSTADDLLHTLQEHPQGLTLAQWLAHHPQLPRRTAQRRISQWLQTEAIRAQGQGRARRYTPVALRAAAPPAPWTVGQTHAIMGAIALSADSRDILTYVTQPLAERKPVGYQLDFLARYQPNQTHYLPEPLRLQLHRMGRTGVTPAPAGTYSRAILNRLLIDLSWASSHLEGNTYSRLDTVELIAHGRAAQGKDALETQMILNHKAAIELLVDNIDSADFNRYTLLNLHGTLAENLLPNPADEGRIRRHAVDIGQCVYRPLAVHAQLEATLEQVLDKARQIADPFEQSFFAMVHLPYLQPFADINKRTSRLAANLPLFRANLCPLTFLDVPESAYSRAMLGVYEMTRVELLRDLYVWAYERSTLEYRALRQDLAEPDPLRLAWRELIKTTVREVVRQPQRDTLALVEAAVAAAAPLAAQADVQALILEELRRLHEGVLARYGLRPSELQAWRAAQSV